MTAKKILDENKKMITLATFPATKAYRLLVTKFEYSHSYALKVFKEWSRNLGLLVNYNNFHYCFGGAVCVS